ncbi:hypothetical protein BD324DRAFT_656291 [Kockovaella imperatae]|uniref:Golgi apparatus membrane protein TVP38 n=1 Tax=Kockovaella imperatae TaxID=4999 RepID=A0A1Y1UG84_9TREE|nr:hypothetical protein BD324DRAFT_656291 [Kockovaella imperatae]ORX37080.1 hypothetical protein BD324DRAFT_656291 [Kockovaella imperatae]
MDRGDASTPNRTPISHPYPPSYRSRISTPESYHHSTFGSSPASSSSRPVLPAPADYHPDARGYQEDSRGGAVGDSYNSPLRQPSTPNYSRPQRQTMQQTQYSVYSSPFPDETARMAPSPDPGAMATQPAEPLAGGHKRSNSVRSMHSVNSIASTHPALKWLIGNRKAMKNRGYPKGWTKEDEDAEQEYLKTGLFDWNELKRWRFWIRKEWWFYYLLCILLAVLVALMAIYHDEIVEWLRPVANWMKDLPAGWVIPIAVLFVLSFPPLFGHEIVGILIGVVWGLWFGFAIMSAGTLLGEIGNFYAFKYLLRKRAEKYERDNVNYACMAYVVREGGFFFIFMARLSAIPGHFTTAVFATCGMNILVFTLACILSMPKQLIVVYLGVLFEQSDAGTRSRVISDVVLAIGFVLTIWSAWYIYKKMNAARVFVWRKQRMEMKRKAAAGQLASDGDLPSAAGEQVKRNLFPMTASPPRDEEEAEMRFPMIDRHQSYQSPYNIKYHPTDNMSVYDVDGPLQIKPEYERDVGYARGTPPYASTETFPEARPVAAPSNLNRQPTTTSVYPSDRQSLPPPTSFPVAQPHESQYYR